MIQPLCHIEAIAVTAVHPANPPSLDQVLDGPRSAAAATWEPMRAGSDQVASASRSTPRRPDATNLDQGAGSAARLDGSRMSIQPMHLNEGRH